MRCIRLGVLGGESLLVPPAQPSDILAATQSYLCIGKKDCLGNPAPSQDVPEECSMAHLLLKALLWGPQDSSLEPGKRLWKQAWRDIKGTISKTDPSSFKPSSQIKSFPWKLDGGRGAVRKSGMSWMGLE